MTMRFDRTKARLAMKIATGRKILFDASDFEVMGFDVAKRGFHGKPSVNEMRDRAEEYLIDMLEMLVTDVHDPEDDDAL